MKLFSVLAAVVGLSLIAALVFHFGPQAVTRSLIAVGWTGFAAVCSIHLALIAVMGIAWGVLMPGTSLWVPVWGRLVRDSGSELLPLSQIGGYVLGARAVALAGVAGTTATASTIADVTLELFGQLAYTALGLSLSDLCQAGRRDRHPRRDRSGCGGASRGGVFRRPAPRL